VTQDTYIVFASNAFAVLGLVPLYFLLAGSIERFKHLDIGLALVLAFVGAKMLLSDVWHVPIWLSLTVIVAIIAVAILTSLLGQGRHPDLTAGARSQAQREKFDDAA
jgi:tellurite resistance protein TerC